jgi:hypothetical protein
MIFMKVLPLVGRSRMTFRTGAGVEEEAGPCSSRTSRVGREAYERRSSGDDDGSLGLMVRMKDINKIGNDKSG